MNATTISRLCETLPPPELDVIQDNFQPLSLEDTLGIQDPITGRFMTAYKNLAFGWQYARTMALNRLPLPTFLSGRDSIIWTAYFYCQDPLLYRDETLIQAIGYMAPNRRKDQAVLNALLMSNDADLETIASHLNTTVEVISAYEILFFNIIDRKIDQLFLASIVYPNARVVELFDHYVENEYLDMLLMRAGFNNGIKHVLYLAGFPSDLLKQGMSGKEVPAQLTARIMANGYIMAVNGFLNQSAGGGLSHARQLLAAAMQGGVSDTQSPFYNSSAGSIMLGEVQRVKTISKNFHNVQAGRAARDSSSPEAQAIRARDSSAASQS